MKLTIDLSSSPPLGSSSYGKYNGGGGITLYGSPLSTSSLLGLPHHHHHQVGSWDCRIRSFFLLLTIKVVAVVVVDVVVVEGEVVVVAVIVVDVDVDVLQ